MVTRREWVQNQYPKEDLNSLFPDDQTAYTSEALNQSFEMGAYHLTPPNAWDAVALVWEYGARKYGDWSYFNIPWRENFRHGLKHSRNVIAGENPDAIIPDLPPELSELAQVCARMMMALEVGIREFKGIK